MLQHSAKIIYTPNYMNLIAIEENQQWQKGYPMPASILYA